MINLRKTNKKHRLKKYHKSTCMGTCLSNTIDNPTPSAQKTFNPTLKLRKRINLHHYSQKSNRVETLKASDIVYRKSPSFSMVKKLEDAHRSELSEI
jgi:hypothetical protein